VRLPRRKGLLLPPVVAILGLLTFLATGCGGGGGEEETAVPPTPEATAGQLKAVATTTQLDLPTPNPQAKSGGTLSFALSDDIATLDPHTEQSPFSVGVIHRFYNRLVKVAGNTILPGQTLPADIAGRDIPPLGVKIVGELAKSWDMPAPNIYIFHLFEGVKFQNLPPVNGRELTSEDVKYSFERILTDKPEYVMRSYFQDIEKIETPDKYTVKITLKGATAPFLNYVGSEWALIVPREVVEQGDVKNEPVGSGPFIFEYNHRGQEVKMKKNPDYFRKGLPYMDGISLSIIKDSATSLAAFRSGKIDVTGAIGSSVKQILKTNPDVVPVNVTHTSFIIVDMNCTKPPFDNVKVRQAVKYALDPMIYNTFIFGGIGQRVGPLGWLLDWTLPAEELPKQDLDKARQLLVEAGYPDGFKTSAQIADFAQGTMLAPIFKDQLGKVGIDVKIETLQTPDWMRRVYSRGGDFNVSVHGHYGYTDPDQYLSPFLTTNGPENNTGYSNATLDQLIPKQRQQLDPAERKQTLYEIQRIILDESPYVYLSGYAVTWMFQPYLKGYQTETLGTYFPGEWEYVWLEK